MTTVFGDYQDNAPGSAESNSTAHSGPSPASPVAQAGNGTGTDTTLKQLYNGLPVVVTEKQHQNITMKQTRGSGNKSDCCKTPSPRLSATSGLTNECGGTRAAHHHTNQTKHDPCIWWSLRVPWNCLSLINATQPRSRHRPDHRLLPPPAGPKGLPGTLPPWPHHMAWGGCRRCSTRESLSP